MFEPPEKGERATLNPTLSTRLNLLFPIRPLGGGLAIAGLGWPSARSALCHDATLDSNASTETGRRLRRSLLQRQDPQECGGDGRHAA